MMRGWPQCPPPRYLWAPFSLSQQGRGTALSIRASNSLLPAPLYRNLMKIEPKCCALNNELRSPILRCSKPWELSVALTKSAGMSTGLPLPTVRFATGPQYVPFGRCDHFCRFLSLFLG